jgi:hypothetical protein
MAGGYSWQDGEQQLVDLTPFGRAFVGLAPNEIAMPEVLDPRQVKGLQSGVFLECSAVALGPRQRRSQKLAGGHIRRNRQLEKVTQPSAEVALTFR